MAVLAFMIKKKKKKEKSNKRPSIDIKEEKREEIFSG
jgi:hypothetical protein